MAWDIFLSALGGATTALAVGGTLAKLFIEQWLKRDFKRFEGKLNEIASLQQMRYSHLFKERSDSSMQLLSLALSVERDMYVYDLNKGVAVARMDTPGIDATSESYRIIEGTLDDFMKLLTVNEVYLEKEFIVLSNKYETTAREVLKLILWTDTHEHQRRNKDTISLLRTSLRETRIEMGDYLTDFFQKSLIKN